MLAVLLVALIGGGKSYSATISDTLVTQGFKFVLADNGQALLLEPTANRPAALVPGQVTDTAGNTFAVTAIAANAFAACSELTVIELPSSVTAIGANAFGGCSNLRQVFSHIGNPETLSQVLPPDVQLSVDDSLMESYSRVFVPERLNRLIDIDDNPLSYNPADANRDGAINAADVTAIYNNILYSTPIPAGDANGDGTVNAADVTTLYNAILSGDISGAGSEGYNFMTINRRTRRPSSRVMQRIYLPVADATTIGACDNNTGSLLKGGIGVVANDLPLCLVDENSGGFSAIVLSNTEYNTGGSFPIVLYCADTEGDTHYQRVTVDLQPHVVTDTLRVLSVGNSFALDALAYVPFIMNAVAPQVYLKLGVMYIGYGSLEDFDNALHAGSTAWRYHHSMGANHWTWRNDVTMDQVLDEQPWDIVLLQQNSNLSRDYSTYQPYLNNVISWFNENMANPHEMGWLITPSYPESLSRLAPDTTSTQMFRRIIESVSAMQRDTGISLLLPCGTAIQNARTTPLDSLGDRGGLFDDLHLQDGMPCLIEAYTATARLLERYGRAEAVWGDTTWVDAAWLTNRWIPEVNGTPVGMSEQNRAIAIKCAQKALENPLEITIIDY